MTAAISVCLVGKESVLKEGVKSLLAKNNFAIAGDYDGVGNLAATDAAQLVVSIDEGADNLPKKVQDLKSICTESRVFIISNGMPDAPSVKSAFDAGVDGLVLKDISCDGLVGSLKLAAAGEKVYPASVLAPPPANSNATGGADNFNLSKQELKIVQCLANGEPNKVIAHYLDITEATVKVHVRTILRKLGTTNRTKAAIFAIAKGLAPAPVPAQARLH